MFSPILRLRIIDDRRLPIRVGLAQFFEQTAGKTEFRERSLELIVVLEFFALLRGHVGLEKDLARVVGLSGQARRARGKDKNRRTKSDRFSSCVSRSRTICMCG